MNRRGFFGTIGKVAAGFMILPGAGRVWKAVAEVVPVRYRIVPNPAWFDAPYEVWMVRSTEFHRIACDPPMRFNDPLGKEPVAPFIQIQVEDKTKGLWVGEPPYDPAALRAAPRRWIS